MTSISKKYFQVLAIAFLATIGASAVHAQSGVEQKVKSELQKQLGERAQISAVRSTPVPGLYEIVIGNDVLYADATARYLIQGEIVDLKTGTNLTEQRSHDLNRIKWSDLPLNDAIKVVRGKGSRQIAVFADPNCGFCKKLEKSFQQLDNVTIYTFLVPLLSADSATKSKQIWCAADRNKAWMLENQTPTGPGDCGTPLDRNTSLAKKLGVAGTPAMFFVDGSRIAGAVPLAQIEKKLK